MEPAQHNGVALTSFDARTATAVVAVLRRAGVEAWAASGTEEDVEVRVPAADRDRAMRELGTRMEEVHAEVQASPRPEPPRPTSAPPPDPDDVHAGPPLVMERFRSMRYLAAVVMAPLLVVTLAPTLRGGAARTIVVLLALVALVWVVVARRRR